MLSRTLFQAITDATDLNNRKKIEPATIQYWSNHTAKKFIQFNDTFVDPMLYTATILFHSSAIAVQDKSVSFNPSRLCGSIFSSLDLWEARTPSAPLLGTPNEDIVVALRLGVLVCLARWSNWCVLLIVNCVSIY